MLHVWFGMFAAAAVESKLYEPWAAMCNPKSAALLSDMLRLVVIFSRMLYHTDVLHVSTLHCIIVLMTIITTHFL